MNWTELKYGTTRLYIPQGFYIEVTWEGGGYKVGFGGAWLRQRFQNLDEAKAQGIRLAKSRLKAALDYLGG